MNLKKKNKKEIKLNSKHECSSSDQKKDQNESKNYIIGTQNPKNKGHKLYNLKARM